jgi:hypothetical protein
MLPEFDVYITDWHNARDVPLLHGRFGFDEYVDHVIRFLEAVGPGAHVVAVCQPCVAVLVAAAVMAQIGHRTPPRSMTLMAGPIDARVNPTKVNELAQSQPIGWFEQNLLASMPLRYRGAFRRVYPGFVQLAAFMSMNIDRHVKAHGDLYDHLANGEYEKARATKAFYDEYFAVLDLTAEFYLETVRLVFQEHALPRGELTWHGERVEPRAIKGTCCSPSRARKTTSALSARPWRRTTCAPACGPISSATTCSPASATTACSAAGAGKLRSIHWSRTSSRPAIERRVHYGVPFRQLGSRAFAGQLPADDCADRTKQ